MGAFYERITFLIGAITGKDRPNWVQKGPLKRVADHGDSQGFPDTNSGRRFPESKIEKPPNSVRKLYQARRPRLIAVGPFAGRGKVRILLRFSGPLHTPEKWQFLVGKTSSWVRSCLVSGGRIPVSIQRKMDHSLWFPGVFLMTNRSSPVSRASNPSRAPLERFCSGLPQFELPQGIAYQFGESHDS